jgi:hypothetical protein
MIDEHGAILLESDMSEIINIVNEMQQVPKWQPIEELINLEYGVWVVVKERAKSKERWVYEVYEISEWTNHEVMQRFYSEFLILPKP